MTEAERARRNATDRLRRRCQALASEIGCSIEREDNGWYGDGEILYWVHPPYFPGGPFGWTDDDGEFVEGQRQDPCHYDHTANGWCEVWTHLQTYRDDLYLHSLGLARDHSDDLLYGPNGDGLHRAWLDSQDRLSGLVYADWLEENGLLDLAGLVRNSLGPRA